MWGQAAPVSQEGCLFTSPLSLLGHQVVPFDGPELASNEDARAVVLDIPKTDSKLEASKLPRATSQEGSDEITGR